MSLCSGACTAAHGSPGDDEQKATGGQSSQAQHRGPGNRPTWVSADNVQQRAAVPASGQDPEGLHAPGRRDQARGAGTRPSDCEDSPGSAAGQLDQDELGPRADTGASGVTF